MISIIIKVQVGVLSLSWRLLTETFIIPDIIKAESINKQIKTPKPCITPWWNTTGIWEHGRNVENTSRKRVFSTFLECSQMSGVFYHSVIHGLGFFICFICFLCFIQHKARWPIGARAGCYLFYNCFCCDFFTDGKQYKASELDMITLGNHAPRSYMTWSPVILTVLDMIIV